MATLAENRDERANAILSYYNNLQTYNTQTEADGDETDVDKPQKKFKDFNELIRLHNYELWRVVGYMTSATARLPSEEGPIDTTEWWYNANGTNLRASMYFTDSVFLNNRSAMYAANARSEPNQRHPYMYWNQYLTGAADEEFGSWNDFGYVNQAPHSGSDTVRYSNTQNPWATTSNYRLREPLEEYGSSTNLLWGRIVHDGRNAYRDLYCGDTSYDIHRDQGFNNYERPGISIGNRELGAFTDGNPYASPYETFRYTYFGSGAHTNPGNQTIQTHSGTSSGTFEILESSASLSVGWCMIYSGGTGYAFYISNSTFVPGGLPPPDKVVYDYTDAFFPTPSSGGFNGTWNVRENPALTQSEKNGTTTDGREDVWGAIYDRYYTSEFKAALDNITAQAELWSDALDFLDAFDYSVVKAVDTTIGNFAEAQAAAMKSDLVAWIADWKTLINDSGSGATFSKFTTDWNDTTIATLFSDADGGLDNLISWSTTSYTSTQSGFIADRKAEIYDDILGHYNLGTDEVWLPDLEDFVENNTGFLDPGKLYAYRYNFTDSRLNRESGTLTIARNAYYTYLDKLDEIALLEVEMAPIAPLSTYDVTPIDFELSDDEEDKIIMDWEDSKGAASYRIDRKEGISGSWTTVQANYDYTDPGDPPDFEAIPESRYEDPALTQGYQELGLNFSSEDDGTGLSEDFTVYDFNIDVDGAGIQTINMKGLDCKTFEALRVAMQSELDDAGVETTLTIETDDIRITSNLRGTGSTVAITAGTTNDLLTALSTTPDAASDGVTQLEQGKVYYYRVRVNNGYNVTLGSDGNTEDKDWDSQSAWQTDEYSNDQATNGDIGYVIWDPPENLVVSGVDEGITPSENCCRLEWDAAPNADSYKVYRATSLNGGYALIDSTSSTYYEDTTGIPGFIYFYKLKAVAGVEYQEYDDDGNFTGPVESLLTDEGVRGKKLWIGLTLAATDEDIDKITLTWNALSGANGYLLYISDLEDSQYSALQNDDVTDLILTGTSYVDERPAKQYFDRQFESSTDGLAGTEYEPNTRYYFQVLGTTEAYEYLPTIEEYFITSPSSGVWTSQDLADSIQDALSDGLDNAICELVFLENPSPYYAIRIQSVPIGSDSSAILKNGSLEPSLLTILPAASSEPGEGTYPAMYKYYKLQAVETVAGEIVRYSELTDIAIGFRPLDLPVLE